ncbi:MAG: DUF3185 domain-containing protein [Acidobacteria bacterium]|nr:DUF3185 domain-containing protein [Acidobacteriota bacterium]
MRGPAIAGVVLLVLGLAGLLWPVFSYTTTDTVADIGPVEVTTEDTEQVAIPPIPGGLVAALGAVLIVSGRRR